MKKYSTFNTLKSLENFISDGGTRLNNKTKQINPKLPVITTITVVKNSEAQIKKTIKSILNQNYDNIEIIVIDGNSDDKTLNEIKKYENKIDYWCCIKDRGIYDAMNYGLMLSSGEVICIINSGDTFKDNALNIVSNYFINNNNLSFLFGTVERHYLGNNMILKTGFNRDRIKYNFDSVTCHSTGFFIKDSVQKEIGLYNLKYKCSSDYDVFFKLFKSKKYIGASTKKNEVIGVVASGGFSSKYGFWKRTLEEMSIRIDNKQNKILIFIIFVNILIKKIFKFKKSRN